MKLVWFMSVWTSRGKTDVTRRDGWVAWWNVFAFYFDVVQCRAEADEVEGLEINLGKPSSHIDKNRNFTRRSMLLD